MSRVTQMAEECNLIPTANSDSDAALDESISDGNVLTRSGDEEDVTLMLSRELALDINPNQADLTASFILYGLYTWQVSKRKSFAYNPKINGKPAAYRSVRELEEDYPWLAHNSILKALRRAEEKLKGEFIMQIMKHGGQDQLHFWLSEKLIKKYKFDLSFKQSQYSDSGERISSKWNREKSGLISFQRNDAIKYGTMGAILITNLGHILGLDKNVEPLEDAAGNIYRRLSPTALTKQVKNEKGEVRAPLPVSPDTITRALNDLKADRVFHEHPTQNNFYTLASTMRFVEGNAAEVNTLAAEVNTSAAKVNTKTEVLRCNHEQMRDIQMLFETSDSSRDRNTDGKCITQQSVSLRETDCVISLDESFLVRKNILLSSANVAIHSSRQRDSSAVPNYDIRDYAVYRVDEYDKVRLIGYDLEHEFVLADSTGKPYTRQLEVDNFMEGCKSLFAMNQIPYTKADKDKLRDLFIDHPSFTPDMVQTLIINDYIGGIPEAPKKGHDFDFFSRKITSVKQFLRYLPQLIREKHLNTRTVEWHHHPVSRVPMFDYSYVEQPLLEIAFADNIVSVFWDYFTVVEEKPEVGTVLWDGKNRDFLTGNTVMVETTRVKPVYYDEYMSGEHDFEADKCIYKSYYPQYNAMLDLPVLNEEWPEPVEYSSGAMKKWERENGKPQFINRFDLFSNYREQIIG